MSLRSRSLRPPSALDGGRRPFGRDLIAIGALATGAVWVALTIAGGGEHPVSVPWPLVAGLITVAGAGLAALILVAQRQSAIATERTAELVQQTALTRFVLDMAGDAVVTIDSDGLVLELNDEAERMFGLRPTESAGLDAVTAIVAPAARDAVRARMQGLDDLADPVSISPRAPAELLRADGTVFSAGLLKRADAAMYVAKRSGRDRTIAAPNHARRQTATRRQPAAPARAKAIPQSSAAGG